jgi:hypothetical protein
MPPTPIPVDYGIATIKYQQVLGGLVFSFTFGYHNTAGTGPNTAALDIGAAWSGNWHVADRADTWELAECYVLQDRGAGHESAIRNINEVGTRSTASPAPAVAIRVTKTTLRAGKKYRGRMYLPNSEIFEGDISSGGTIAPGTVTALQGKVNGWRTAMSSAGYPLYLLHRDLSAPNEVINCIVRNSVGTQRRRQHIS